MRVMDRALCPDQVHAWLSADITERPHAGAGTALPARTDYPSASGTNPLSRPKLGVSRRSRYPTVGTLPIFLPENKDICAKVSA